MTYLMVFMRCFCVVVFFSDFLYEISCGFSFELHWQVNTIQMVVGTHLNCFDKLMQFKWVQTTYAFIDLIDWLCWGLTTRQPLWVILCRLPEKGRKEIEEIVEEMKETISEEIGTGMKENKQKK